MPTIRVLADGSVINAGPKPSRDYSGFLSFIQDPDDTETLTIDWTGYLGSETISTATWTAGGLTLASSAISGKTTTTNVSAVPLNTHGSAEVLMTTSAGRIKNLTVRFYGREA